MDISIESVGEFLKIGFWLKFATNLLYISIGLYMARGTVRKHFSSIEEKLERMAQSMLKFGESLSNLETDHSMRISRLEGAVNKLSANMEETEAKVSKLKE